MTPTLRENDGQQFDRLPATADERAVEGRATREAVLEFWHDRFGIEPATFEEYTFWEKGAGKVWLVPERTMEGGGLPTPLQIEALGMTFLRTRQEHWKPTTEAAQRFGRRASRNVVTLDPGEARRFLAGEEQAIDWDGDWGYLIAARETLDRLEPIGVGLFVHGELKSMVPKGRRREP